MTLKTVAAIFAFNEGVKLLKTLQSFPEHQHRCHDLVVMDDGSTERINPSWPSQYHFTLLRSEKNLGIGRSIKRFLNYARSKNYEIVVFVAGNGKDDPKEITKLVLPIEKEGYDFIQGSRYLRGGYYSNMPTYRFFATKFLHPLLMGLYCKRKVTDSTNGFRAFRLTLLEDSRIDINQGWLDKYELEPYLYIKAMRNGHKVKEVAVSKSYPPKKLGQTKMKPIIGWWSILRPLILMPLGLKK